MVSSQPLPQNTPKPSIRTPKVKLPHHRRTQTHPHHPHLRRRHRPPGRRSHQAFFAAEGPRRRKRHHPLPADDPFPRTRIAESVRQHQMRQLPYRLRLLHDSRRPRARQCLRLARAVPRRHESRRLRCVIGNPPYDHCSETGNSRRTRRWNIFVQNYKAAIHIKLDTYHLFIEQGITLCRGKWDMFLNHALKLWLTNQSSRLRCDALSVQATQLEAVVVGSMAVSSMTSTC